MTVTVGVLVNPTLSQHGHLIRSEGGCSYDVLTGGNCVAPSRWYDWERMAKLSDLTENPGHDIND